MTFDLDPDTAAARDRARAAAAALAGEAAAIDGAATIAGPARQRARAALAPEADRLAWVIGVEELATVSASLAVDAALVADATAATAAVRTWMGLRGADLDAARRHAATDGGTLAVSAVLVGLARAALDAALAAMRSVRAGGGKPEQQQWTVADAATELDAARLLLWRAASMPGQPGAAAMARLQARTAADAALHAARRVLGADAGVSGAALDRLTRDLTTALLVFGGADDDEAAVADAVLPAAGERGRQAAPTV
jgi:hypothetical protein